MTLFVGAQITCLLWAVSPGPWRSVGWPWYRGFIGLSKWSARPRKSREGVRLRERGPRAPELNRLLPAT